MNTGKIQRIDIFFLPGCRGLRQGSFVPTNQLLCVAVMGDESTPLCAAGTHPATIAAAKGDVTGEPRPPNQLLRARFLRHPVTAESRRINSALLPLASVA